MLYFRLSGRPDASVEEAEQYVGVMRAAGLDTVFLAAPTSTDERLKLVAHYSRGFIYVVSRTGVTGEQQSISASVGPLIEALRRHTDLPLAVGLTSGASTPDNLVEAVVRLLESFAAE